MYVWRNNEALSSYHCFSGKAINISYSECVFLVLSIPHAMRLRYIVIWPLRLYNICLPYPINGNIFEKKKFFEHTTYVLTFSTSSAWNISHSTKKWSRYDKKVCCSSCKVPVIPFRFEWDLNFLDRFSKNTRNITYHENLPSDRRVVPYGRTYGET
jgi:hypothetical protein